MASSYKRVTRSQRAVEYPATKIPMVTIEKACIYVDMPSEGLEALRWSLVQQGGMTEVLR